MQNLRKISVEDKIFFSEFPKIYVQNRIYAEFLKNVCRKHDLCRQAFCKQNEDRDQNIYSLNMIQLYVRLIGISECLFSMQSVIWVQDDYWLSYFEHM